MLLLDRLKEKDSVIILDGGLATELMKDGYKIEGDPLWSARVLADTPEALIPIHLRFLEAGARIIETGSYQACIPLLRSELGLSTEAAERTVAKSVKVAAKAKQVFCHNTGIGSDEVFIAGSIGPFGCVLHDGSEYTGTYIENTEKEVIIAYHQQQAKVLEAAGVDLLAFDTIPSLAEAECILKAVADVKIPFWISFSCKIGELGPTTSYGDCFAKVVQRLNDSPVAAIGVNCSPPEIVSACLTVAVSSKRFVVYPNSGECWRQGEGWYQNPEKLVASLSQLSAEWKKEGAGIIGGCCRVGPKTIREIKDTLMSAS